jgi:putative chitinase
MIGTAQLVCVDRAASWIGPCAWIAHRSLPRERLQMITTETLRRFAPRSGMPDAHARALEAARMHSSVDTPRRLCHFMGQIFVETGGIAHMIENLNYRNAARLDAIFRAVRGIDDAKALIARGPEAIANRVYANRLGNGNEASGDGWRYRGSGYKQLTGRANYRDIGRTVGFDLEGDPELARAPEAAARIAYAFWDARGCSSLADAGDVEGITARINGPAKLGLAERRQATLRAIAIWR